MGWPAAVLAAAGLLVAAVAGTASALTDVPTPTPPPPPPTIDPVTPTQEPTPTQTSTLKAQEISFPRMRRAALNATPPVPAATASSGLPITYSPRTPDICDVTSTGTITLRAVGKCQVIAAQPGDSEWAPAASVYQTFNVIEPLITQQPTRPLGMPSKVEARKTTRLVRLPVVTNADQNARVRVIASVAGSPAETRSYYHVTRTGTAVKVWTSGERRVTVTVIVHAPAVDGYTSYSKTRTYEIA